jgi:uncharacterized protein
MLFFDKFTLFDTASKVKCILNFVLMQILIIGATGFIGRELVKELLENGHRPVAVTRNTASARGIFGGHIDLQSWDGLSAPGLAAIMEGSAAVINLAGENIGASRWTNERKKLLTESRVRTGEIISEAARLVSAKPEILIQGSAIGIYGTPLESATDESSPAGKGFMAGLTAKWEASVLPAKDYIPRIAWIRTGLVLGRNGGLLAKILLPFRFYSGTVIGPGNQWMSWIHMRDQVRAIRFILENEKASGPYNLTAPEPVRMKEFIKLTGQISGRPVWLKAPAWALKALLGEMADETVLASQNIYPGKLLKDGFSFEYTKPGPALANLLTN